ncbi:hypothetical protein SLEP1_g59727 [Rubroshorea leprosula]|uniref:Uncharacterized protein n=1 Tax=Rubroshorea leprosula TaxID=152421 RepID=A0AAV5MT79_9ROSI|nr:hypothetical protein SLEP1_g59727 [Rubroshorea leprosula]
MYRVPTASPFDLGNRSNASPFYFDQATNLQGSKGITPYILL